MKYGIVGALIWLFLLASLGAVAAITGGFSQYVRQVPLDSPEGKRIQTMMQMELAETDRKFALILFVDTAIPQDWVDAQNEVLQDRRIGTHVLPVTAWVKDDPDSKRLAERLFGHHNVKPEFPAYVVMMPTAKGFASNAAIRLSAVTAPNLRNWIVKQICSELADNLEGAPAIDYDLTSLCKSGGAENKPQSLQPLEGMKATPRASAELFLGTPQVHLPLTPEETDLSQKVLQEKSYLKATWKGMASRWLCGKSQPPIEVVLKLEDRPLGRDVGNVSGTLTVGGAPRGTIEADYGGNRLQTNALAMASRSLLKQGAADLQFPDLGLSEYFMKFSARDPWGGFGFFQTLSGVMFRSDASDCTEYANQGEVLKVDLKKQ